MDVQMMFCVATISDGAMSFVKNDCSLTTDIGKADWYFDKAEARNFARALHIVNKRAYVVLTIGYDTNDSIGLLNK